jgi:hypothetical protein
VARLGSVLAGARIEPAAGKGGELLRAAAGNHQRTTVKYQVNGHPEHGDELWRKEIELPRDE